MAEKPVINASPLIFLSRGGLIDLLQLLGDEILVPSAVAVEIQQRGKIPAARPVLDNLRSLGMYLSDRVINQALALIGE